MMQHLKNETIVDYVHDALSPQDDAAVYAHIESCEACRQELDAEAALSEMLRSYGARTQREMPATLKAEIWSRIRSAQPSLWERVVASLRPAVAVPAALVLAAAAYFGVTYLGPQAAPSIEAVYYLQDHAALNSTIPFSDHGNLNPVDLENSTATVNSRQTTVSVEAASSYTAYAGQ